MYKHLFNKKTFFPIFWVQCFGAFNDNAFKNALLITLSLHMTSIDELTWQSNLSTGLFILPLVLFSAISGQIADKYNKAHLVKKLKMLEVLIVVIASLGFYMQNFNLLIFTLFLMGTQSAFYTPLKYSMLPEYLTEKELLAGNALVESSTIIVVLFGTIIGSIIPYQENAATLIAITLISTALLGLFFSTKITPLEPKDKDMVIQKNPISASINILKKCSKHKKMLKVIIGISWFWMLGAFIITQLPAINNLIGGTSEMITMMLVLFSIGVGIGSLLCNRLLNHQIDSRFSPFCLLGMSIVMFNMSHAIQKLHNYAFTLKLTFIQFMSMWLSWRLCIDILLFSILGGIFIVPLYTILQHETKEYIRARMIACNNIISSLFMLSGSIITMMLSKASLSLVEIIQIFVLANTITAIYLFKILSFEALQVIARSIFKILYRVEVKGIEHCINAGKRVLVIANHVSFLDAPLLGACLPGQYMYAINTEIAKRWGISLACALTKTYSIDARNSIKTKSLIQEVANGNRCIIFPEGRITTTGSLMKVYDGVAMIAKNANAVILPVFIDGAEYSPFSYMRGKFRIRWFPKIKLTISPARHLLAPDYLVGKQKREYLAQVVYDTMTNMIFEGQEFDSNLFISLLESCKFYGYRHTICEDMQREQNSYYKLISKSLVLRKPLAKIAEESEYLGIILPNSVGLIVTIFSLFSLGKVPALLNYSSGIPSIASCCKTAKISKIITSRKFVELGGLEEMITALEQLKLDIVYLEDLAESVTKLQKLTAAMWPIMSKQVLYRKIPPRLNKGAALLFTSGSEGQPKGVLLSHKNLQTAVHQVSSSIDLNIKDVLFNPLPIFHSFGLACGTIMPILHGIKVFTYPSPLHYRIIPEMIYDTDATVVVGTSTFLNGYQKFAHPYDFCNVRYVFAGAEKLNLQTRQSYFEQFGVRILEGYGATETSPVISINTPMHHKQGSAGRILPGMDYKLTPHEGVEDGGRLWVRGGNVMLGYFLPDNPGVLQPPKDGWHDTGDIVNVTEDGFVTIIDRAKRFAKIAGEMISLTSVENILNFLWPAYQQAVLSLPCDRKGEKIICVTNNPNADRKQVIDYCATNKISELNIPAQVVYMSEIPTFATGKVNYPAIKEELEDNNS
jgi:acyl-[acyl-carrier-protein]-phospholipid O-acyltransferase/long-chain-fatty-acid--[acyl-carrier-protein] ligase